MIVDGAGKALGLAPLCIERKCGFRLLRSFPVHFCDDFAVLVDPAADQNTVFDDLCQYLASGERWDTAMLAPVNDRSDLYRFLDKNSIPRRHLTQNVVSNLDAYTWDSYLGSLSKSRRRLTRKKMKAFEAAHKVSLRLVTDEDEFERHFERVLEIQSLRATKDRADRSPRYMECARQVYRELACKGQLMFYLLCAGETVIAYRIGFRHQQAFFDWNTNYDIRWSGFSPGLLVLVYVIRDLIERGFGRIDFMAGAYDYKVGYSPTREVHDHAAFVVASETIRGAIRGRYELEWRDRLRVTYYRMRALVARLHPTGGERHGKYKGEK